jgi:hypothetical protein
MSGVPANIQLDWAGPDRERRIRVYATSLGKEIGAATALPDVEAPGAWVVSDMHFLNDDHWESLGHVLLDRLVSQIEVEEGGDTSVMITASLDNIRFRNVIAAHGTRVQYVPEKPTPGLAEQLRRRGRDL